MKNFVFGLALVLASFNANATANSWAAINKNLDVVAQDVKSQYPYLTSLSAKFDAQASDLAGDSVALVLSAGTDQAIWGNKQAVMTVGAALDAKTVVDTQRILKGTLSGSLQTQTIAALKHVFRLFIQPCNEATLAPAQNYSEVRDIYYCKLISKLDASTAIADVQVALVTTYADFVKYVPTYIQEQRDLIKVEKDPAKVTELEYNISAAESDLKMMSKVKMSGDMNKVVIDVAVDVDFAFDLNFGYQISLTESEAAVVVNLEAKIEDTDYQDYKAFVVDIFARLEQNDAELMESFKDLANGYAGMIGELITK